MNNENVSPLDQQMKMVMYLMGARAAGKASNQEVEAAVERMLALQRNNNDHVSRSSEGQSSGTPHANVRKIKSEELPIVEDKECYDDVDGEDTEKTDKPTLRGPRIESVSVLQHPADDSSSANHGSVFDPTLYDDIPLGRQGAKMMMNFGDGKCPKAEAVEAVLLGSRLMLQTAIQDARHIRRKQKKLYKSAKESLREKETEQSMKAEWSTELLFRAGGRTDRLSRQPKCGFDIEEIRQLFPEEMNAFTRWMELHAETKQSSTIEQVESNKERNHSTKTSLQDCSGGHLHSRAAQFDMRTDRMKQDWYIRFSEVRQGSFLPKGRGNLAAEDAEWESSRKANAVRGRPIEGIWSRLTAAAVRFLHWVGFDPQSPLPPPDDITTQALAFLGHDFFGRIVEKAIFLRNLDKKRVSEEEVDETSILLELEEGEQLETADIARAMEDPDIKPVPLYSSSQDKKIVPQLYFGLGFENRLEMEMEEYVRHSKNIPLTDEELRIRQEEDELFQRLSAPPSRDKILSIVDDSLEAYHPDDSPQPKRLKLTDSTQENSSPETH